MPFKRTIKYGTFMAVIGEKELPLVQEPEVYLILQGGWIRVRLSFVYEGAKYCAIPTHVHNEEGSWHHRHVAEVEKEKWVKRNPAAKTMQEGKVTRKQLGKVVHIQQEVGVEHNGQLTETKQRSKCAGAWTSSMNQWLQGS